MREQRRPVHPEQVVIVKYAEDPIPCQNRLFVRIDVFAMIAYPPFAFLYGKAWFPRKRQDVTDDDGS
jgi:hypothetical protein